MLLRILALSLVGNAPLSNEAPGYMEMAEQFSRHEVFDLYWPPGVPLYLYFVQQLIGYSVLVGRASILPIYLLFSVFLFAVVKRIGTLRAANLAVLTFAFYPPYVRHSFNPSTEYAAAMCLMGIVLLMILARKEPRASIAALAGGLVSILILIRPSSFLVAVLVFFYFLRHPKGIRLALLSLVVAALPISMWMWKAYSMSGRFVIINESNAQNFFWGNNQYTPLYGTWGEAQGQVGISSEYQSLLAEIESHPRPDRDHLYAKLALQHIIARPDLFAIRTFNRALVYFGFPVHHAEPLKSFLGDQARKYSGIAITVLDVSFYWSILVLAICFFFSSVNVTMELESKLAVFGTAFAYAAPYWVSMSQPRYNFPIIPLLAVPAVMLLDSLFEKPASEVFQTIVTSRRRRYALALALSGFFLSQFAWIYMAYFYLPV